MYLYYCCRVFNIFCSVLLVRSVILGLESRNILVTCRIVGLWKVNRADLLVFVSVLFLGCCEYFCICALS
jgi:hypothetical protein